MSEGENLFGQEHVERYRETDGAVGHIWKRGVKTLLLTTKGRKTGRETTTPLIYERSGSDYVIVASKGGAPQHPGWYRNLARRRHQGSRGRGAGEGHDLPGAGANGGGRRARASLEAGDAPVAGL
jgi:F420H(2)-dependent quinone reductase